MALVVLYRLEDALRVYGPNWQGAFHGGLRSDHGTWLAPSFDLVRDWAFCAITGLAVPLFAQIKSRWINPITKRVAQYSYGIYLSHVPILWICFTKLHLGNVAVAAGACTLLTALASFTLYHCVEKPGIGVGKHLSTRLVNRKARTRGLRYERPGGSTVPEL